jgi:hypothetical protein
MALGVRVRKMKSGEIKRAETPYQQSPEERQGIGRDINL